MKFTRFGIYFTPADTAFAKAGASWLGWDITTGQALQAPHPQYVKRPRKYGFHATLKPPFRLVAGMTVPDLKEATIKLAGHLEAVKLDALKISRIGNFFAFTPAMPNAPLQELASRVVRDLDRFRAAATEGEIAKRLTPHMTETQKQNLLTWGYPYVMDSFHFHMTLTGPVPKSEAEVCLRHIENHFAATAPEMVSLDAVALVAERPDGNFCELARCPLGGTQA